LKDIHRIINQVPFPVCPRQGGYSSGFRSVQGTEIKLEAIGDVGPSPFGRGVRFLAGTNEGNRLKCAEMMGMGGRVNGNKGPGKAHKEKGMGSHCQ